MAAKGTRAPGTGGDVGLEKLIVLILKFRAPGMSLARMPLLAWSILVTAFMVLFAAVQFSMTLWGYDLPRPIDWVPLLLMSLTVGVFESIFFRGFVQNRLEASFGPVLGVGLAAGMYSLYHVGYGMGAEEIVFLAGLGVVYALAFLSTRNVLVLWPLLTPLGSLFNNLEAADIELPWASMAGFGEVLIAMVVVLWLAHRYGRRHQQAAPGERGGDLPAEPVGQGRVPARVRGSSR